MVNPYDWCVANRIVNGSQQTLGWQVDYFIIIHVDAQVNNELADWLNRKSVSYTHLTLPTILLV